MAFLSNLFGQSVPACDFLVESLCMASRYAPHILNFSSPSLVALFNGAAPAALRGQPLLREAGAGLSRRHRMRRAAGADRGGVPRPCRLPQADVTLAGQLRGKGLVVGTSSGVAWVERELEGVENLLW